jgi:magnesium transporter
MPIRIVANPPLERPTEVASLVRGADGRVIWIDLLNPTTEERRQVERVFGIDLPTLEDMKEIETTSRLYSEDGARFMTAPILSQVESSLPQKTEISFILVGQSLVTIRETNLKSFGTVMAQCDRRGATSRDQVLLSLLDAIIDRQADLLERVAKEIDTISQEIFQREIPNRPSENVLRETLCDLGRNGDLIAREQESLVALSRLVQYAGQTDFDTQERDSAVALYPRLKPVARDLHSLTEFAGFLSNKVNFLLDATLGLIQIEQSSIVKIFTVAAVIFLPPTLVASIYGMNFDSMPELHWDFGYPFALVVMILSVIVPLWYCRRKNWL